jgi:hypothetical protein
VLLNCYAREVSHRRQPLPVRARAALVIKKGYPVVQVSVYDRVGNTNTLVELPVASR